MIFHWGTTTTGITNSSHSYGLLSSKLQNSGHRSPLEWYFNGVLTLPILQIPKALRFQNSGQHSPLKWYFTGVQPLALPILHFPRAVWFLNSGHHSPLKWYFTGVQPLLALPILHIPMAFWVQSCQILATLAHWNNFQWGPNTGIANS